MRNIRQNLFFAFVYNSLGVPIAAGVLYPFFGLLAEPDSGGGGDELEFGFGDYEFAALAEGEAVRSGANFFMGFLQALPRCFQTVENALDSTCR